MSESGRVETQKGLREFWESLNTFVNDYIGGYECRGDDGDYTPNKREAFLIEDCVAGLLYELSQEGYLAQPDPAIEPDRAATPQASGSPAENNWWCPDACPITGLPFFMWITHPDQGWVPTYGGPYDSYTIPVKDDDGDYVRQRFDHDEGGWLIDELESVGVQIVDSQLYVSEEPPGTEPTAEYELVQVPDGWDLCRIDYHSESGEKIQMVMPDGYIAIASHYPEAHMTYPGNVLYSLAAAMLDQEPAQVAEVELSDYVTLGDVGEAVPRRKAVKELWEGAIQNLPIGTKLYTNSPKKQEPGDHE